MPWGLRRFQKTGDLHFVTFSCYRRQKFLTPPRRRLVELALERARVKYRFYVVAYVVMPEHVHLLVSEPERSELATAIQAMKQSVARRVGGHFWHFFIATSTSGRDGSSSKGDATFIATP